jgi:MFS family permease
MTTSWARIALLYAIGVLAAGQLGILPPLVPALQRDLGLSLTTAGMAVSLITFVGALLGLPAGRACERIGHVRSLAIGLAVMAAAAALCAAADSGSLLLFARALAGAGYLLVVIACPSLMAGSAEPRHHPLALSMWGTFVPVGIALGGLATAPLAGTGQWRAVFVLDALVLGCALVAAPFAASRPVPVRRQPSPAENRAASLASLRRSAPLAVAFFCFALLFLALAGLLPAYLVDVRGLAESDAGRIVAVATAAGIAGSLAAGGLMHRGASPAVLAAIGLLASAALAAVSFSATIPLAIAIAGFAGSFAVGGLAPAATFASVPKVAADLRAIGPINGLLAQAGSLGSLAGPPVLAVWVEGTSWTLAPLLLLVIAGLGAALLLAATSRR